MLIHTVVVFLSLVSGSLHAALQEPQTPTTQTLCSIEFGHDLKRPTRVDNEAKACLDDVAMNLQRDRDASLIIVGHSAAGEKQSFAAQRAANVKVYLVQEKGIDGSRLSIRAGGGKHDKNANIYLIPVGAVLTEEKDAAPVKEPMKKSE
jgi:outer membrane protein OmpA-like peptidoglycan-associated protein